MPNSRLMVILVGLSGLVFMSVSGMMFQNVDADEIVVIQAPASGRMKVLTTPGVTWQGMGKVTTYKKMSTYNFETQVRFNDGGHGVIHGSVNYELPLDNDHMIQLHTKYGSQGAIQKGLVETVVNKCVYMTGPLMSSKESYAEKRTNLIFYIEDQIRNGVYATAQKDVRAKDPVTGQDKTVTLVEVKIGDDGKPQRQEESVLLNYNIKTSNFAVTALPYDETVEGQIKQQQELTMKVQTAVASSKEAEQRAITVAKEGEANAAKAKWEQEVLKAQAVTKAQQEFEVSKLEAMAAEQTKRKEILLGEGEATRRRLVMSADGALDKKLAAYVETQKFWAEAMSKMTQPIVPQIVTGGSNGTSAGTNGVASFMELMGLKAARELAVDVKAAKKGE